MTPEQVALLRGELKDAKYRGKTSREIARMLSKRVQIPNPTAARKVPAPFTADNLKVSVATLLPEVKIALINIIAEQGAP